jgi:arginase
MPLRMILDSGVAREEDTVLIGARELDPPEDEFLAASGVHRGAEGVSGALEGTDCTYVAIDLDVAEPSELSVFMPEPGGLSLTELERLLRGIGGRTNIAGAGLTGLTFEPSNVEPLDRLTAALGM